MPPDGDIGLTIVRLLGSAKELATLRTMPVEQAYDVVVGMAAYLGGATTPLPGRATGLQAGEIEMLLRQIRHRVRRLGNSPEAARELPAIRDALKAMELSLSETSMDGVPDNDPRIVYRKGLEAFGAIRDALRCLEDPTQMRPDGHQLRWTFQEAPRWVGSSGFTVEHLERLVAAIATSYWGGSAPSETWYTWAPEGFAECAGVMRRIHVGVEQEPELPDLSLDLRALRLGTRTSAASRTAEIATAARRTRQLDGVLRLRALAPRFAEESEAVRHRERTLFAWILVAVSEPDKYVPLALKLVDQMAEAYDNRAGIAQREDLRACMESAGTLLRALEFAAIIPPSHPLIQLANALALRAPEISARIAASICLEDPKLVRSISVRALRPMLIRALEMRIEHQIRLEALEPLVAAVIARVPRSPRAMIDIASACDWCLKFLRAPVGSGPAMITVLRRREPARVDAMVAQLESRRDSLVIEAFKAFDPPDPPDAGDDRAPRVPPIRGDQVEAFLVLAVDAVAGSRLSTEDLRALTDAFTRIYLSGNAPSEWGTWIADGLEVVANRLDAPELMDAEHDVRGAEPGPPLPPRTLRRGPESLLLPGRLRLQAHVIRIVERLDGPVTLMGASYTLDLRVPPERLTLGLALTAISARPSEVARRTDALKVMLLRAVDLYDAGMKMPTSYTDPAASWKALTAARDLLRVAEIIDMLRPSGERGELARWLAQAVSLRDDPHQVASWIYSDPTAVADVSADSLGEVLGLIRQMPSEAPAFADRYRRIMRPLIWATWQADRVPDDWRAWSDAVIGHVEVIGREFPALRRDDLEITRAAILLLRSPLPRTAVLGTALPPLSADEQLISPALDADLTTLRAQAEAYMSRRSAAQRAQTPRDLVTEIPESILLGVVLMLMHDRDGHTYPQEAARNLLRTVGATALAAANAGHPTLLTRVARGFLLLHFLIGSDAMEGARDKAALRAATLDRLTAEIVGTLGELLEAHRVVLAPDVERLLIARGQMRDLVDAVPPSDATSDIAARISQAPDRVAHVAPSRLAEVLEYLRESQSVSPDLPGAFTDVAPALIAATWRVDRRGLLWDDWAAAVIEHAAAVIAGFPSPQADAVVLTRAAILLLQFPLGPAHLATPANAPASLESDIAETEVTEMTLNAALWDPSPPPPLWVRPSARGPHPVSDPEYIRAIAESYVDHRSAVPRWAWTRGAPGWARPPLPQGRTLETIICGMALILAHDHPGAAYRDRADTFLRSIARTALDATRDDHPETVARVARGFLLLQVFVESGTTTEISSRLRTSTRQVLTAAANLLRNRTITVASDVGVLLEARTLVQGAVQIPGGGLEDRAISALASRIYEQPDRVGRVRPPWLARVLRRVGQMLFETPTLYASYEKVITALVQSTWRFDRTGADWRAWAAGVFEHATAAIEGFPSPQRDDLILASEARNALILTRAAIVLLQTPHYASSERRGPPLALSPADPSILRAVAASHLDGGLARASQPSQGAPGRPASTENAPSDSLEAIVCGMVLIRAQDDQGESHGPRAEAFLRSLAEETLTAIAGGRPERLADTIRGFLLLDLLVKSRAIDDTPRKPAPGSRGHAATDAPEPAAAAAPEARRLGELSAEIVSAALDLVYEIGITSPQAFREGVNIPPDVEAMLDRVGQMAIGGFDPGAHSLGDTPAPPDDGVGPSM